MLPEALSRYNRSHRLGGPEQIITQEKHLPEVLLPHPRDQTPSENITKPGPGYADHRPVSRTACGNPRGLLPWRRQRHLESN